jgi:hypothetical protein
MAIDPMHNLQLTAGPPAEVAHLGLVSDDHVEDVVGVEIAELRVRLETERSAGRALVGTIGELERRLAVERTASESLLTTARDLEATLDAERASLGAQRKANGQLWSQVHDLKHALHQAERPVWRKLLRRP